MECDSDGNDGNDGEGTLEPEYAPMGHPSFMKQLQNILSEYPDGGQIIKELLQNAEDADARQVKLLFDNRRLHRETGTSDNRRLHRETGTSDNRRLHRETGTSGTFTRFFQAPALCVCNDAVFTEKDWQGIQMVYSSVKEGDRLKVGRFGLGFKSVFHITDYPCIISGDRMLLIDHQQSPWQVNATLRLNTLRQYKGMNVPAFLETFNKTFGYDEHSLTNWVNGTLMWFPLRESKSPLSDTIYTAEKVNALFDAIKNEASSLLIFLKNVTSMSWFVRENANSCEKCLGKTAITENTEEITLERNRFQTEVLKLDRYYDGEPLQSCYVMAVQTSIDGQIPQLTRWMVVNYFMGGNASEEFRRLIRDESIGYSPYVGVAAPIGPVADPIGPVAATIEPADDQFTGHIFCFLPLPKEGSSLTQLPVHVNGFFALSQNRHHLKWPTKDQNMQDLDDKSLLWNVKLVTECLPLAYEVLLKNAVEYSRGKGDSVETVASVYAAIPDTREALDKWKETAIATLDLMRAHPLLYRQKTESIPAGWVRIVDARFATLDNLPETLEQTKEAVVKLLGLLQENYVDISKQLLDKLNAAYNGSLQDLTPKMLITMMRENDQYLTMTAEDKLKLLTYILSDNCYDDIEGLQLLPLASGGWGTFSKQAEPVYVCKEEEIPLFPGFSHRILKELPDQFDGLVDHFNKMMKRGCFQLVPLCAKAAKSLIVEVINRQFTVDEAMHSRTANQESLPWLAQVWQFILDHRALGEYLDVPIVPVLTNGCWPSPQTVDLVRLSDPLILQKYDENSLPESVCLALQSLKVQVIPELPSWIEIDNIDKHVHMPDPSSVLKLISKQVQSADGDSITLAFNTECLSENRDGMLDYLCEASESNLSQRDTKLSLKQLRIFQQKDSLSSEPVYVSLSENSEFAFTHGFPVRYPKPLLSVRKESVKLLKILGAYPMQYNELILQTLSSIIRSKYSETDVAKFMKYFIGNFRKFEENTSILGLAKQVAFLENPSGKKKPSELFNPDDDVMKALFEGEDRFPVLTGANDRKYIDALKCLGLQEVKDVSAEELWETASLLDHWSNTRPIDSDSTMHAKAIAFLHVLSKNTSGIDLERFSNRIADLKCIKCETERVANFPEYLPWFAQSSRLYKPTEVKHIDQFRLIGSSMPLVKADSTISGVFKWNGDPPLMHVIRQVEILKKHYEPSRKPDILAMLKDIYQHLSKHLDELADFQTQEIIWIGDGFNTPSCTVMQESDLDLRPYFFYIPSEFHCFQSLFLELGCNEKLTTDVYISTLSMIDKKHTDVQTETAIKKSFKLVLKILRLLSRESRDTSGKEDQILIPVQSEDDTILLMKPLPQCTYDENSFCYESDEDGEKDYFVHEEIPLDVARALGVKSTSKKALSEAEDFGVEEWGQDEPLTTRLRTLLEGYTDGMSVPKELIQNADDAEATEVKFLYDERANLGNIDNLLSAGMKSCQGPALWVYNNATFTDEDLENITKLNGGTKGNDAKKIGKFGLGFCSVYNLTDVPSFISRSNIVVFDPHTTYLEDALPGKSPGLKIDFSKRKNRLLVKRKRNQFVPYQDVFGCDVMGLNAFDGTLFRFPLRNHEQAQTSKISSICYSKKQVHELLSPFIKTAGNMFLFTQHVKSVKIYHLDRTSDSPTKQVLLFSMTKECFSLQNKMFQPLQGSVLSRIAESGNTDFVELQKSDITLAVTDEGKREIPGLHTLESSTTTSWLCSWANNMTTSESTSAMIQKEGAFPLSAVAVPCSYTNDLMPVALESIVSGFAKDGKVFCFLPLPLQTGLQVHINGCFDVSSDRRQLIRQTEDDKSTERERWNLDLMSHSLVKAFIQLLLYLSQNVISTKYLYHSLWPVNVNVVVKPFQESFFGQVVSRENRVFKSRNQEWVSFRELIFLDPNIRDHMKIGEIALDTVTHFPVRDGKSVVDLPTAIVRALQQALGKDAVDKAMITEEEMARVFLSNIENAYWNTDVASRDEMILFILNSDKPNLQQMMRTSKCIPTEPCGKLQKPDYLVNPSGTIAKLYCVSDGRFPTENPAFRKPEILLKLNALGMLTDKLPAELLVERCESIDEMCSYCCVCGYERCSYVLEYLNSAQCLSVRHTVEHQQTLQKIKQTHIIPVMSRPSDWAFSWKAESCTSLRRHERINPCAQHDHGMKTSILLGRPIDVYRHTVLEYIGSLENIAENTTCYSDRSTAVFDTLQIKGDSARDIPLGTIVDQILICSQEYNNSEQLGNAAAILEKSFEHLDKMLREDENNDMHIKRLHEKPVLLCGQNLVTPAQVAHNVKNECAPHLYRLGPHEQTKSRFYECIGVKEYFPPAIIVNALNDLKDLMCPIGPDDVAVNNDLLIDLEESLKFSQQEYSDLETVHDDIVAPDIHGTLWATHELVIDDEVFATSETMHILHSRITPGLAKLFGAKSKQKHSFLECGMPFGQKEELVTRISGLLKSYPCDAGIMKELLQNADDAGATEIHFIKDFRELSREKIFGDSCSILQGPALCVFNDSYFKEEDFEGIRNLGIGSKSDNPTKTGQYGVGFNAVYHLTDLPSFVTKGPEIEDGGALCIFDPLCKHIPHVQNSQPGMRCQVDKVKKRFPNVLLGFLEEETIWKEAKGTLFRLPLRTKESGLKQESISPEDVDSMLSDMKEEMFAALTFVKNVNTIRISNMSDGILKEEYAVHITINKNGEKERKHFFERVQTIAASSKHQKEKFLSVESFEVGYEMTVEDTSNRRQKWYVVQRFGFDQSEKIPDLLTKAFQRKELGMLPIGGIATHLEDVTESRTRSRIKRCSSERIGDAVNTTAYRENAQQFRAFCFLPLPIKTGLPVHLHGHFALDHESRRDLWNDGDRRTWNECLIRQVITPAYMSALHFIGRTYIDGKNIKTEAQLRGWLELYNANLPIHKEASNEYWKLLIETLYKRIIARKRKLFPVVRQAETIKRGGKSRRRSLICEWVAVSQEFCHDQGVFNDTMLQIQKRPSDPMFTQKEENTVVEVLKSIGMEVIETPLSIYDSMVDSGLKDVSTSTPNNVILFMKGIRDRDKEFSCVGGIDKPLSETTIGDIDSLQCLIKYMKLGDTFDSHIQVLPILLTNDEFLKMFSEEHQVFHTEYCTLLPSSAAKFVHKKFLSLYPKAILCERRVCIDFNVHQFEPLLADTLNSVMYKVGKTIRWNCNEKFGTLPNVSWIQDMWTFILETSNYRIGFACDNERLRDCIAVLSKWSLLPTKMYIDHQYIHQLKPIDELLKHAIVDVESFNFNADLKRALACIGFPMLDDAALSDHCIRKLNAHSPIASFGKPDAVLSCLLYHSDKIKNGLISSQQSATILAYLSSNLDLSKLSFPESSSLRMKLKSLPLYVTQQNTTTSLDGVRESITLPVGIPDGGMQELASTLNIAFLKYNHDLTKLYSFLSVSQMDEHEVYATHILPNIRYIPEHIWLEHIAYVKDKLLLRGLENTYSFHQQRIIQTLKGVAFVKINGQMKCCSDLFCHRSEVFRVMCEPGSFPPPVFQQNGWPPFFSLLGMPTKVSDQHLLMFAEKISTDGGIRLNDKVKTQSDCIRDHFLRRIAEWKIETTRKIGQIKFILPAIIPPNLTSIYKQKSNVECFVRFRDCIPNEHLQICWSTADLLRTNENIPYTQMTQLGMSATPDMTSIIQHLQNVSTELETLVAKSQVDMKLVTELMTNIYTHFWERESEFIGGNVSKKLESFPTIYLREHSKMVTVKDVVRKLSDEQEVPPYLYAAPEYFGKHFNLFRKLGMSDHVLCFHYTRILERLHRDSNDNPVVGSERAIVQKVISNLVNVCNLQRSPNSGDTSPNFDDTPLYLPNKQKVLVKSELLTISTGYKLEQRLESLDCIQYFLGFRKLDIHLPMSLKCFVMTIPEKWRPRLLRDDTRESVSMEDVEEVPDSIKAADLEYFLHSPFVVQGFCRILKQQCANSQPEFDVNGTIATIGQRLLKVQVREVKGLNTYILYKNNRVPGSDRPFSFHQEYNTYEEKHMIYFVNSETSDRFPNHVLLQGLVRVFKGLARGSLINELNEESVTYLHAMFNTVDRPESVPAILDDLKVDSLDLKYALDDCIFPRPGTYVEKHFYPFLEQALTLFERYEYRSLAFELEDREMDDDDYENVADDKRIDDDGRQYIYVRILKEVHHSSSVILTKYLVDTGATEPTEIPAYRLFRFVRTTEDAGTGMVLYDTEAIETLPFDENCKRVRQMLIDAWTLSAQDKKRVIRRLLLKWHPDKNRGAHEEYANRIFNYIKCVILQLEENERVDETVDDQTGRTAPDMEGSYFARMTRRVSDRSAVIEAAWKENFEDYRRGRSRGRRGRWRGRSRWTFWEWTVPPPHPDIEEATRWIRQAKLDYRAAECFISSAKDVEGYNWICYTCHQASEKAMKAALFVKDANKVPLKSHSIVGISYSLSQAFQEQASRLQARLGEHTRMRYPNVLERPKIPADLFSEEDATFALQVTDAIIRLADEQLE